MVSKWEGQFLGGIIMIIIGIIVGVFTKDLSPPYNELSAIGGVLGLGGLALTGIGIYTKKKSGH